MQKAELSKDFNIETVDSAKLDSLIGQRNNKSLFLNVWATWCAPCREEFPDIVKLVNEFDDNDIEFIGISVDYADEIDSKVKPFVESMNINFQIYVQQFASQEVLIEKLHKEWSGALPATFIYDATSALKKFSVGKQSYSAFKSMIAENTGVY